jgi:hypothetical protein
MATNLQNSQGAVSGIILDSDVQRFAGGIFANEADKTYATFEESELKALPKSLFYDGATSRGPYEGLFAYYVLGKSSGGSVKYALSDKPEYVSKITSKESRNPTAQQIISSVTALGSTGIPAYADPSSPYRGQLYNVKDFIFCKHYGVIPNNRMITLRRFPSPTLDSLRTISPSGAKYDYVIENGQIATKPVNQGDIGKLLDPTGEYNSVLPVAQAVTYFGDGTGNSLNTILGINTGLKFSYEGQTPMKNEKTGDPGLMNSPFGDLIKSYLATGTTQINVDAVDTLVGTVVNPQKNLNALKRMYLDAATTGDGPLSKKIFVNVNTVDQVLTRKQGFNGGTETFTLNFDYNLTSVGDMNSKLLFLDLMTNLLSLGSDYGTFLAPELRLEQSNVGIGFPGGAAGYAQSITDPVQFIQNQVTGMLSGANVQKILDAEKNLKADVEGAVQELKNFVNDPDKGINRDSKLYKSLTVLMTDVFLKQIYFQPIMLSGYPTGSWHVVVGNPLNPIAMMGNLVCTGIKITLGEDLGPDDFPTTMQAQFTLQPGRQRHRGDWESIFNRGNGRLYLGQLVEAGESTNAWINTSGIQVNAIQNNQGVLPTIQQNLSTTEGNTPPQGTN